MSEANEGDTRKAKGDVMIHPYDCAAAADERARELRDSEPPAMCNCDLWAAPRITTDDQIFSIAVLSAALAVSGLPPVAALAVMPVILKYSKTKGGA